MAEPFLAEIRLFSFAYAPRGWALCNGQILPISQNQALFSLLGTTYGGNGVQNFALPNAQDRVFIGFNNNSGQGTIAGEASHTLTNSELPYHTHAMFATTSTATTGLPTGGVYGTGDGTERNEKLFSPTGSDSSAMVLAGLGGNQAHENHQPSLVVNFCIALQGIFPSRN